MRRAARRRRGCSPCPPDAPLSSTGWPSASCPKRRCSFVRAIRWSRLCTIRSRWNPGSQLGKPISCARANARRWPRHSHVIVTSAATARHLVGRLRRFGRPHHSCVPGHRSGADGARRSGRYRAVALGRRGRATQGIRRADRGARRRSPICHGSLTIAGDRSRDPETAAQLDADIARYDLGSRVAVLGAVSPERLAELYAGADLFVLASRFEGYGMAYAEAIARRPAGDRNQCRCDPGYGSCRRWRACCPG